MQKYSCDVITNECNPTKVLNKIFKINSFCVRCIKFVGGAVASLTGYTEVRWSERKLAVAGRLGCVTLAFILIALLVPRASAEENQENSLAAGASHTANESVTSPTLQGELKVVPAGTKLFIIMSSSINSDTCSESDEFSARTADDVLVDGLKIVPAGSLIKGRVAAVTLRNSTRSFKRFALRFETFTTSEGKEIPFTADFASSGRALSVFRGREIVRIDLDPYPQTALCVAIGGKTRGENFGCPSLGIIAKLQILRGSNARKPVIILAGDCFNVSLAEDLRVVM